MCVKGSELCLKPEVIVISWLELPDSGDPLKQPAVDGRLLFLCKYSSFCLLSVIFHCLVIYKVVTNQYQLWELSSKSLSFSL